MSSSVRCRACAPDLASLQDAEISCVVRGIINMAVQLTAQRLACQHKAGRCGATVGCALVRRKVGSCGGGGNPHHTLVRGYITQLYPDPRPPPLRLGLATAHQDSAPLASAATSLPSFTAVWRVVAAALRLRSAESCACALSSPLQYTRPDSRHADTRAARSAGQRGGIRTPHTARVTMVPSLDEDSPGMPHPHERAVLGGGAG